MVTDWIVAICTIVYVVATIFIMLANWKSAELSRKQILESQRQFEKQQRLAIRPYLNLYVARENETLDKYKHYSIRIGNDNDGIYKNVRTFSIRNIGNGTAKNIEIYAEGEELLTTGKDIAGRNSFILVDRQYVYDLYFNDFENITLICKYTDLYDNDYEQKMKIYLDKERNEMVAHTDNPVFGENNLKNEK